MQQSIFSNQILLPNTTAAAWLTSLGVSTYMQGILASADQAALLAALNLAGGTYVVTATGVTNVDSVTAVASYVRVSTGVSVNFYAAVDPTAAGATTTVFRLSLPVTSNLTASTQLSGSASTAGIWRSCDISGDTTNDAALVRFESPVTSVIAVTGSFGYPIV